MKTLFLLGSALLLGAPAWADPSVSHAAHGARPLPAAADPALPAPPLRYQSAFGDAGGVEPGSTDWKKANADVGEFRQGFVDILKWEAAQEAARGAPAAPTHRH